MFQREGRSGWYVRLYAKGKEKVRALGTDYAAACDKARLLKAGIDVAPKDGVTVSEACGRWLESHVRIRRIVKGQLVAAQRVRDYIEPFMGTMQLDRVTRDDIVAFRIWLESRTKLSPATVTHVLSDIRCMLNWCEDGGLVERSVFPRHVMPEPGEQLPDRLTDEEAARIAALPEPWGFVCRFALGTGLRWGEMCRAQAADVKRLRGVGEVEDQWLLEVSHTKSGRVRRVPLLGALLREVRQKVGVTVRPRPY